MKVKSDLVVLDKNGDPLSQTFMAELRGFFAGEGCFYLHHYYNRSKKTSGSVAVYCKIDLRADDGLVLEELQSKLGGSLTHYKYKLPVARHRNPMIRWLVSTLEDCERIVCILSGGEPELSFKKMKELPIWQRVLEIKRDKKDRGQQSYTQTEMNEMNSLILQLKESRKLID
jgi:hypothetical protein